MSRFWNTGICFLTLLMNGLISRSDNTLSTTGPPTSISRMFMNTALENEKDQNIRTTGAISTIHPNLTCPIGTLPPNTTNCNNRVCPVNEPDDKSYPCMPGYREEFGGCTDITECSTPNDTCNSHSKCRNTVGGYYCKCNAGYQKDHQTEFCPSKDKNENKCADIDECSNFPGICGSNAICNNTPGSYNCTCDTGFANISNTCIDKDECSNSSICGSNAICSNTPGSYKCACNNGFTNKSNTCEDIDECSNSPGICGSNATCNNTQGSYKCICDKGFTNISNTCIVKCKYSTSNETCTDEPFRCKLKSFTNKFTPFCESSGNQNNVSMEEFFEGLDDLIHGGSYGNKTDRLQKAGLLLTNVEETIQTLALLGQKAMSHVNKQKTTSIQVSTGTPTNGSTLSLQGLNSIITLDSKAAAGNTGLALLGCIEYTKISHILEGADFLEKTSTNQSFTLVSPVVSVFLGISNTSRLQQPVSLRLNFTQEVSRNLSCVSWSVAHNGWTSEGCVMVENDNNGITCNCTHLTSFAVLMLLKEYESWPLTLITQIGLSISIFCLVLAIITFWFCRSLRGTRNTIHTHLCISLLFGNCIFLLGITAVRNQVVCGIVAGLLHAFYLCSFCWMLLEGLELYRMLVTVFKTHLKKRYLLAMGYGTPAVIVTISAAIYHEGYGTKKYCWLSLKKGFIWAFMAPVCVIILVNCGIFVLTVWKLTEKMSSVSPEQGKLKRIRTLTMTSLAQLVILGTCWVFGFFMFSSATPFFAYVFTILNALQGLQIFCLHCLMHKKVRTEYKRWLCALAHFKSPIYSEFSNTSNSHTHSKGKTGKESGL